ncbi:MAG: response regulator [Nanoarchaeota archaeon]|nr:response regulator [Nanoarchaeota archaeon]MBU1945346.1 response regulator [Nanoarchaeota archaeon]
MSEQNLRALVIDDEISTRDLFPRFLNRCRCSADVAETCKEGIEKFNVNPALYDLVVTDLNQTPSGTDIIQAVRTSTNPNIPVYIMTGGTDSQELYDKAKELVGEERFIQKPFDFDSICKRITKEAKELKYK